MYLCAQKKGMGEKKTLGIIDFTKPSNEKRLWIFDLENNKLLFNTWVAHGTKSGELYSKYFSNKESSHASSIGLYLTGDIYTGKHGESLRLKGLEPGFNNNVLKRSIVLHGAWYVGEDFIKKYGRIGRSWGCTAVADNLKVPIVNAMKNGAIMIAYYPDKMWVSNSKFINCE